MATPSRVGTVSPASAATRYGPTVGYADASTSTSQESVDLSAYEGTYVLIWGESADHYCAFAENSSVSMDVDAAALGTAAVPFPVASGAAGAVEFVVPRKRTVLLYRTISGSGTLRVLPT